MKEDNRLVSELYNKYLLSSVLAILFSTVGQIVNNVVIGNAVSSDKLSVTGLVLPIYYVFATVGNLMAIGGSAVCSRLMTERETRPARAAFTVTYAVTVAACILLGALTILLLPAIIPFLGTPDALYEDVYQYALVMCLGGVFTAGIYLSFNFLRMDGKTVAASLVFVVMGVVNVLLDYLFVVVGDMGVMGISLATSLGAMCASVLGALALFLRGSSVRLTRIGMKDLRVYGGEIVRVGSPGAVENICILIKSFLMNRILAPLGGSLALGAYSVLNSVNGFAQAFIYGASGTIVPFVGVFSTEKDTRAIRGILAQSLVKGAALTLPVMLFCLIFPETVASVFGLSGEAALSVAVPAIRLFSLSFLPALVANLLISLHLSNSRTALANVLTALRSCALVVPLSALIGGTLGISFMWNAFWLAEIGTLLVAAVWQFITSRRDRALSPLTLLDESFESKGHDFSCAAENSVDSIMECVDGVREFCAGEDMPPKKAMRLSLAVEEMLTSIRDHSLMDDKNLTISVRIMISSGTTILRIRNRGKLFNPLSYYDKKRHGDELDLDAALELTDSIGIKMIVDTCEIVYYRTTFGINNLTVIL
ncbi:MAG: MATE family efflux transporter [Eubacteriales bacterium]|nr:MATE family efflux transporter [Eubacteriales bacterium]MDD3883067.1 MATE family efflux transporter [Eubacteriales bacterium]MDD4513618.1 MATE family efflux transporter [Eubacteriales bacterium]